MGRLPLCCLRVGALIAALTLVHGCRERDRLEKEAPALARADLVAQRIAVGGVVSNVRTLADSGAAREDWSRLLAARFGRELFGSAPIVSFDDVREALGGERCSSMLDRYKAAGRCDSTSLADLHTALEGKARFIVFAGIEDDGVTFGETETEDKKYKTKTKTMTASRMTWVRLRFYDLAEQRLVWEHRAFGFASMREDHDMTDVIKHGSHEGVVTGLATSIINSELKPEPKQPPGPEIGESLAKAFDSVAKFLLPKQKR